MTQLNAKWDKINNADKKIPETNGLVKKNRL